MNLQFVQSETLLATGLLTVFDPVANMPVLNSLKLNQTFVILQVQIDLILDC